MTDVLTDSFCERCGRRFSLEQPDRGRRSGGLGRARLVARGLQRFVLSNDPLDEAFEGARRDDEQGRAQAQLHVFHTRFSFCLQCRQYTCADCWNESQSLCLTCAPLPERAASDPIAQALAAENEAARAAEDGTSTPGPGLDEWPERPVLDASAWPVADLVESRAPLAPLPGAPFEPIFAPLPVTEAPANVAPAPEQMPPTESPAGDVPEARTRPGLRSLVARLAPRTPHEPAGTAAADEAMADPAAESELPSEQPEPTSTIPRPRPSRKAVHRAKRRSHRALVSSDLRQAAELGQAAEPAAAAEPGAAAEPVAAEPAPPVKPWQVVAPEPAEPAMPAPAVWPPHAPVYRPRGPQPERPVAQVPPAAWVPRAAPPSVWEASAGPVINRPGSGVRACGSCGLALSASARFCRRCGLRQG